MIQPEQNMGNPLVSILIPAYNVEKYLRECLDSVVNQTYRNLQIVIVDDGSKDDTEKICDEYATTDERVEVYHISNGGVANARNVLLSKIKGEYFLFVDSDDWIEPDTIEFLISKIIENNADIVTYEMFKNVESVENMYQYNEKLYDNTSFITEFLRHNKINGSLCNKIIKTSLIENRKFRTDISYGEDALFCWELLTKIKAAVVTNVRKYYYRMNTASLSHRRWTPEGKGSGKIVWDTIREDVIGEYPQFISLVNSRCALMYMWDLIFASRCNYPKDNQIRARQRFINAHVRDLRRHRLAGMKQYLTALILGRWYGAGKIINKFM